MGCFKYVYDNQVLCGVKKRPDLAQWQAARQGHILCGMNKFVIAGKPPYQTVLKIEYCRLLVPLEPRY